MNSTIKINIAIVSVLFARRALIRYKKSNLEKYFLILGHKGRSKLYMDYFQYKPSYNLFDKKTYIRFFQCEPSYDLFDKQSYMHLVRDLKNDNLNKAVSIWLGKSGSIFNEISTHRLMERLEISCENSIFVYNCEKFWENTYYSPKDENPNKTFRLFCRGFNNEITDDTKIVMLLKTSLDNYEYIYIKKFGDLSEDKKKYIIDELKKCKDKSFGTEESFTGFINGDDKRFHILFNIEDEIKRIISIEKSH